MMNFVGTPKFYVPDRWIWCKIGLYLYAVCTCLHVLARATHVPARATHVPARAHVRGTCKTHLERAPKNAFGVDHCSQILFSYQCSCWMPSLTSFQGVLKWQQGWNSLLNLHIKLKKRTFRMARFHWDGFHFLRNSGNRLALSYSSNVVSHFITGWLQMDFWSARSGCLGTCVFDLHVPRTFGHCANFLKLSHKKSLSLSSSVGVLPLPKKRWGWSTTSTSLSYAPKLPSQFH